MTVSTIVLVLLVRVAVVAAQSKLGLRTVGCCWHRVGHPAGSDYSGTHLIEPSNKRDLQALASILRTLL
jgi:hypothetical protein